jgi:glycosyltransferase involved in cell wall biosynthesis
MSISVIIPTQNRCILLEKTLESIYRQTLDKSLFEVIVVDNGSIDSTKKITESYQSKLNLIYLYEDEPGLHVGRHAGLRESHYENLVYIDDDIEAFPEWLETIYTTFENDESVVLIGGKNLPNYEISPPFWILEMWNNTNEHGHVLSELSILDYGEFEKEISPYFIFGCNFSIRKKILLESGGFHPDGMPFELIKFRGDGETYVSQYVLNNGFKAFYHPKASVYHWVSKERMTEEYFCKRKYIQGISDAYTNLRINDLNFTKKTNFLSQIKSFLKIILGFEQLRVLNEITYNMNLSDFQKKLNQSYNNGYNYLKKCYERDDRIKKWVHKNNYF